MTIDVLQITCDQCGTSATIPLNAVPAGPVTHNAILDWAIARGWRIMSRGDDRCPVCSGSVS